MLITEMPVRHHWRIFERQLSGTGFVCSISYVVYRTKNLCWPLRGRQSAAACSGFILVPAGPGGML
jgi:hypothetical protein